MRYRLFNNIGVKRALIHLLFASSTIAVALEFAIPASMATEYFLLAQNEASPKITAGNLEHIARQSKLVTEEQLLKNEELQRYLDIAAVSLDSGSPLDAFQRLLLFFSSLPLPAQGTKKLSPTAICDFWKTLNESPPFNDKQNEPWQNFLLLNGEFIHEFLYGSKNLNEGKCGEGYLAEVQLKSDPADMLSREVRLVFNKPFEMKNERMGVSYWLKHAEEAICPQAHPRSGKKECPSIAFKIKMPDSSSAVSKLSKIQKSEVRSNYKDDVENAKDKSKEIAQSVVVLAKLREQYNKYPDHQANQKAFFEHMVAHEKLRVLEQTRKSKELIDQIQTNPAGFETISVKAQPPPQFWMESPSGWNVNVQDVSLVKSPKNEFLMIAAGEIFWGKVAGAIGGTVNDFKK